MVNLSRKALIIFSTLALQSCVTLAPDGIRDNRLDFNQSIHETNDQQFLLNIVRVSNYEAAVFTNVVEQDIQTSASSTVSGGSNTINALLPLGMLNGSITLSQAPTNKILVPYGIDIINQYDTPISLGSVNHLYQSNFPLIPLLNLTFQRITPNYTDYDRATDLINALDSFGALDISNDTNDTLIISLRNSGTLPTNATDADRCFINKKSRTEVDRLWHFLVALYGKSTTDRLAFTMGPRDPKRPLLPTNYIVSPRTALGALKETQQLDQFKIVDRETADRIRASNMTSLFENRQFYYIDDVVEGKKIGDYPNAESMWMKTCSLLLYRETSNNAAQETRALGKRRAFVLIVRDSKPQFDAFTSVNYRGSWYSILNDDNISKHNLSLLATVVTIETKASENVATPTVLAIGAK